MCAILNSLDWRIVVYPSRVLNPSTIFAGGFHAWNRFGSSTSLAIPDAD
jgi:hypothetical protein